MYYSVRQAKNQRKRIAKLLAHKNKVVGKLTGGLAAMAKMRKVTVVRGLGQFAGANHLQVQETAGDAQSELAKARALCFACPFNRRKRLFICPLRLDLCARI